MHVERKRLGEWRVLNNRHVVSGLLQTNRINNESDRRCYIVVTVFLKNAKCCHWHWMFVQQCAMSILLYKWQYSFSAHYLQLTYESLYVWIVPSPLCVWKLERVCSQTQLCQLRCFNDYNQKNYMFRHLLAIVSFSSRECMVLLYILCVLSITCTLCLTTYPLQCTFGWNSWTSQHHMDIHPCPEKGSNPRSRCWSDTPCFRRDSSFFIFEPQCWKKSRALSALAVTGVNG